MRAAETIKGLTPVVAGFLASRRLGHLGTADDTGRPHVIPICYVFDGHHLFFTLDEKPKRVDARSLRRVRNLLANPRVAVVIDDYDEDWTRLAFVLVHGQAQLIEPATAGHAAATALLREKYAQYRSMALDERPVVQITLTAVRAWGEVGTEPAPERASDRLGLPAVIRGRRSVRAYQSRPVPRALLDECLTAAGWAPSPHGRQPWRFAIISRPEVKRRLVDAMADEWQRQLSLDGQSSEVVQIRLQKSRERMLEAPILVLACLYLADLDVYPDVARQAAEETMAIQSLGAAVQNLLLTAYHLGLDGGWMCAPLFCPEIVASALGLAPGLIPHALITIGYAARDPVRRPRRPLTDLIVLDA